MGEAQAALRQLADERHSVLSDKDAAVRRVVDLQNRVAELQQEVAEARGAGTPHGELRRWRQQW